MTTSKIKCFFFDRDGIVNRAPGPGYVESWDDFHLLPEFVEVLRKVTDAGYQSVVITNQRCVARGIITEDNLKDMHQKLQEQLKEQYGLSLLEVYYCPHDTDSCECRKPKPGMILQAGEKYNIDLAQSWMVGDRKTDVETGIRAGCRTIYVTEEPLREDADITVASMKELVSAIDSVLASPSSSAKDII